MFTFSQYKPDYFFLNFDTKKLYEWKKKQNININDSFYHIWNKRKKNITYIVLKGQEEKTLSLIDKIFKSRKTDIVLLPDVSSDEGINPPINIEDLSNEENNIFELIKKYSIPYIGYNKDERIFIDKALKKFKPQKNWLYVIGSYKNSAVLNYFNFSFEGSSFSPQLIMRKGGKEFFGFFNFVNKR